jgi:hypothetical protein
MVSFKQYLNEKLSQDDHNLMGFSDSIKNNKDLNEYTDDLPYGWFSSQFRNAETDKYLESFLKDSGYSDEDIVTFIMSSYARHLIDDFEYGLYKNPEIMKVVSNEFKKWFDDEKIKRYLASSTLKTIKKQHPKERRSRNEKII